MHAMEETERESRSTPPPRTESETTMNAKTSPPTNRGLRRALALLVALLLASLAFGVGLPWMIVDAPPSPETLWAEKVQSSRAPASDPFTPSPAPRRPAGLTLFR
jgi:hypothetical protein